MAKIKYCIFDVGGVCYDNTWQAMEELILKLTKDKKAFEEKEKFKSFDYKAYEKGEINFSEFCREICKFGKIEYNPEIDDLIDEAMHQGVGEFYQETKELMQKLKQQGIKIGLLTNAFKNLEDTVKGIVDKKFIFASFELGLVKPDKQIYLTMLKKLNAKPEEVIFIDDKIRNINAANELGIRGIVFDKKTIAQEVEKILLS